MMLVVGVDAGGTTSRAVAVSARAATGNGVVGRGSAGPGNPISAGPAAAAAVGAALRQALTGHDPGTVAAAVLGIAGTSVFADPAVAAAFEREWSSIGLTCPMTVVGDVVTAFAAGTSEPSGTVLISGTGAIAAHIEDYRIVQTADGLGWLLGDEGSGLWIGLEAVRTAARSTAHGALPIGTQSSSASHPETGGRLAAKVAAHVGVRGVDELIRWASRLPLAAIAELAPLVCAEARAGDPDAIRIVGRAVTRLTATLDELGAPDGPVVLAGSVLTADTPVRDGVLGILQGRNVTVTTARDPAAGAAWLATRHLSHPPSDNPRAGSTSKPWSPPGTPFLGSV
jgi:glucosamine kinase